MMNTRFSLHQFGIPFTGKRSASMRRIGVIATTLALSSTLAACSDLSELFNRGTNSPSSSDSTPIADNQPEQEAGDSQNYQESPGPSRGNSGATGGNHRLAPGFLPDPVLDGGVSGGAQSASDVAGTESTLAGDCSGFVGSEPNHILTASGSFEFFSVGVISEEETTLVMVGDNGTVLCNASRMAVIEESLPAGDYEIYVGSPNTSDSASYQIAFSEFPFNPNAEQFNPNAPSQNFGDSSDFGAGGDYAPISVATGFDPDPRIGTGNTGGPLQAENVAGSLETETGQCIGYIDTSADHFMTLETPFRYLRVEVDSNERTSLVIFGPNDGEVWCSSGRNPYIFGEWDAGEYEVYIANLSEGVGGRYELYVTELD